MTEEQIKKIIKRLEDHEKRILVLESMSENIKLKKYNQKDSKQVNHSGPKGGILFLIRKGILKNKKTADDVWAELEKEGYIYKRDVVQTALNRLSKQKGLLVKIEEKGKKVYAQRK